MEKLANFSNKAWQNWQILDINQKKSAKFSDKPGKIGKPQRQTWKNWQKPWKNWQILVISLEKLANFREKAGKIGKFQR